MEEKEYGYLLQDRKQFNGNDLLWDDGTEFDSRSAWQWLVQSAAWKDGKYHTQFRYDELKRGEFVASLRYLAERFRWKKDRVARFLALLSKAERITRQRTGQHGTVYLIVNYDYYQTAKGKRQTANETPNATPSRQPRDKVEDNKDNKPISGYPADFELLWKAYPKRPGSNKAGTFEAYNARLKDGCSFEMMFEGTKAYHAFCMAQGWLGTNSVKMPVTFFGPKRHFADDWTVAAPQPQKSLVDDRATRIWNGMKRTKVLFSQTPTDWQTRMADMVANGEADSVEQMRTILKAVNRAQLQDARNDHFAIQQIADVLPPNLKIA